MNQIQELFNILKDTPQMALWGISIYFLFILLKLASWIGALTVVAKIFINRLFNYKDASLSNKRGIEIAEFFESKKIDSVDYNLLIDLLKSMQSDNLGYIHGSDLRNAIELIKGSK